MSVVTGNVFDSNVAGLGGAMYVCCNTVPTDISGNEITSNWAFDAEGGGGILIHDDPGNIHHNIIEGNRGYGVLDRFEHGVMAVENWWGDQSGPGGAGPGTGDSVSTGVMYDPWKEAILHLDNATGSPGTMAAVPISLRNQMDICEILFTIQFDEFALGWPLVSTTPRMATMTLSTSPVPGGMAVLATGPPPGIIADTGVIIQLHFDLPHTVTPMAYPLALTDESAINCLGDSVNLLAVSGTLEVTERFRERTEFCVGHAVGVAWGDVGDPDDYSRHDGDLDLAQARTEAEQNRLFYRPNVGTPGDYPFLAEAEFGTSNSHCGVWGDYDNDGDLDLAVGNAGDANELFVNDSISFLRLTPFGTLIPDDTRSMAWGDWDGDSDLDLAVANYGQNYLYRNDGNSFLQILQFGSDSTNCIVWGDYDNDGDIDAAVGNVGQNKLYVNLLIETGLPNFNTYDEFGLGYTMGMVWLDYDNDRDLDLALTNGQDGESNRLYTNLLIETGMPGFDAGVDEFGLGASCGLSAGDFDNDGDLDVAIMKARFQQNELYINEHPLSGTFSGVAEFGSDEYSAGCAFGDYDDDGDVDLAVANPLGSNVADIPGHSKLYQNLKDNHNFIKVRLIGGGIPGYSNKDGIGSRITISNHGSVVPAGYRQVSGGSGYCSEDAFEAHFGVTEDAPYDIRVEWASGHLSSLTSQSSGATYLIVEGCGDVDGDGAGPNVADLTYLVAYLFSGGPPPPMPEASNIDGDNGINIADLTYLVAFLFSGGPPPICGYVD